MTNITPDFTRHTITGDKAKILQDLHDTLIQGGFSAIKESAMGFDVTTYKKPFQLKANGQNLDGYYEINMQLRKGHPGAIKMTAHRDKIAGERTMYEQIVPITGRGFIFPLAGTKSDINKNLTKGLKWLKQCK